MEIINLLIILTCSAITIVWSMKKRFEIKHLKIEFMEDNPAIQYDEYEEQTLKRQKQAMEDMEVKTSKIHQKPF